MFNSLVYCLTIEPRRIRLEGLLPNARVEPAGSRYVCNPPVMNTDIDFLIYCDKADLLKLTAAGYIETKMQYGNGKPIVCFRKRCVNLITTHCMDYFCAFMVSTHLCKRFNVRDKRARVEVHEGLRGGLPVGHDFFDLMLYPELRTIVMRMVSIHRNAMVRTYYIQHNLG